MNSRNSSVRARLAGVGTLVILALTLSACQGDAAPAATTTAAAAPTGSASPTPDTSQPTAASDTAPARNLPRPELSAVAKTETKEGLRAFADYWFTASNYGLHTGDFTAYWEVTNPDCTTCKNVNGAVPARYQNGGWVVGGNVSIDTYSDRFEADINKTYGPLMKLKETPSQYFKGPGIIDERNEDSTSQDFLVMYARFQDGSWRVADFGKFGGI